MRHGLHPVVGFYALRRHYFEHNIEAIVVTKTGRRLGALRRPTEIWTAVTHITHSTCQEVLLIQPSCATLERPLSLLENSFHNNQAKAMKDYIGTSLMPQYNNAKGKDIRFVFIEAVI